MPDQTYTVMLQEDTGRVLERSGLTLAEADVLLAEYRAKDYLPMRSINPVYLDRTFTHLYWVKVDTPRGSVVGPSDSS